jgi:hypothetical protein
MAISDRTYDAGLDRLLRELADENAPQVRADHLCLLTIRGERKAAGAKPRMADPRKVRTRTRPKHDGNTF